MADDRNDIATALMLQAQKRQKDEELERIFGPERLAELRAYEDQRREEAVSIGDRISAYLGSAGAGGALATEAQSAEEATKPGGNITDWGVVGLMKAAGSVAETATEAIAQAAQGMEYQLALPHQLAALHGTGEWATDILADKVAQRTGEKKEDVWFPANDYLKSWVRAERKRFMEKHPDQLAFLESKSAEEVTRQMLGLKDDPQTMLEELAYIAAPVAWDILKYRGAAAATKMGPLFPFHMALLDTAEAIRRGDTSILSSAAHGQVAQTFLSAAGHFTRLPRAMMTAAFFGGLPVAQTLVAEGPEAAAQVAEHPSTIANALTMTMLGLKHEGISNEQMVRYVSERAFDLKTAIKTGFGSTEPLAHTWRTLKGQLPLGTQFMALQEKRMPTGELTVPQRLVFRLPDGVRGEATVLTGEPIVNPADPTRSIPGYITLDIPGRIMVRMSPETGRPTYPEGVSEYYDSLRVGMDPVILIKLLHTPGFEYSGKALTTDNREIELSGVRIPGTTPERFRETTLHELIHGLRMATTKPEQDARDLLENYRSLRFRDGSPVTEEDATGLADKLAAGPDAEGRYSFSLRERQVYDLYDEHMTDLMTMNWTSEKYAPGPVRRLGRFMDTMMTSLMPSGLREMYIDIVKDIGRTARMWERPEVTTKGEFPELFGEKYLIKEIEEQITEPEKLSFGKELLEYSSPLHHVRPFETGRNRSVIASKPIPANVGTQEFMTSFARDHNLSGDPSVVEGRVRPLFILPNGDIVYSQLLHYGFVSDVLDAANYERSDLVQIASPPGLDTFGHPAPENIVESYMWLTGAMRIAEMSQSSTVLQMAHSPTIAQYAKLDRFWRNFNDTHLRVSPLQTEGEWGGVSVPPKGHYFSGQVSGREAVSMLRRAAGGIAPDPQRYASDRSFKLREVASATESVLENAVLSDKFPKNIQPDALLNQLKRLGVKDEEMKWANIGELAGIARRENRRIPKDELLDWIRTFAVDVFITRETGSPWAAPIYTEFKKNRDALRADIERAASERYPDEPARTARVGQILDIALVPCPSEEYALDTIMNIRERELGTVTREAMNPESKEFLEWLKRGMRANTAPPDLQDAWNLLGEFYNNTHTDFPRKAAEEILSAVADRPELKFPDPTGGVKYVLLAKRLGLTNRDAAIEALEEYRPVFEERLPELVMQLGQVRALEERTAHGGSASHSGYNQFYNPANLQSIPKVENLTNLVYSFIPPSEGKMRSFGSFEGAVEEVRRFYGLPPEQGIEAEAVVRGEAELESEGRNPFTAYSGLMAMDSIYKMRPLPGGPDSDEGWRIVSGLNRRTGRRMFVVQGLPKFVYEGPSHGFSVARRGAGILGWTRGGFFKDPNTGEQQAVLSEMQGDWYQTAADEGIRDMSTVPRVTQENIRAQFGDRVEEVEVHKYKPNEEIRQKVVDYTRSGGWSAEFPAEVRDANGQVTARIPEVAHSATSVSRGMFRTVVRKARQWVENMNWFAGEESLRPLGIENVSQFMQSLHRLVSFTDLVVDVSRDADAATINEAIDLFHPVGGRSRRLSGVSPDGTDTYDPLWQLNNHEFMAVLGKFIKHRGGPPVSPEIKSIPEMLDKRKQHGVVVKEEDWNDSVRESWERDREAFLAEHGNYYFDQAVFADTREDAWKQLENIYTQYKNAERWSKPTDAPWMETWREQMWMDWARYCAETGSNFVMWQGPLAQYGRYSSDLVSWSPNTERGKEYSFQIAPSHWVPDPENRRLIKRAGSRSDVVSVDPAFVNMGPAASRGYISEFKRWADTASEEEAAAWTRHRKDRFGFIGTAAWLNVQGRAGEIMEWLNANPDKTLTDAAYSGKWAGSYAGQHILGIIRGGKIYRIQKDAPADTPDNYQPYDPTFEPIVYYDNAKPPGEQRSWRELVEGLQKQYKGRERWHSVHDPASDSTKAFRYDIREKGGKYEIVRVDLTENKEPDRTMGVYDSAEDAKTIADTLPSEGPTDSWRINLRGRVDRTAHGVANPEELAMLPREQYVNIARDTSQGAATVVGRELVEKDLKDIEGWGMKPRQMRALAKAIKASPEGGFYAGRYDGWKKMYVDLPTALFRKRLGRFGADPQPIDISPRPRFMGRDLFIRETPRKQRTEPERRYTAQDYATKIGEYGQALTPVLSAMDRGEMERMHNRWVAELEGGNPMPLIEWVRQYVPDAFSGMEQMHVPERVIPGEGTEFGVYYKSKANRTIQLAGPFSTLTEAEAHYQILAEHQKTGLTMLARAVPRLAEDGRTTIWKVVRSTLEKPNKGTEITFEDFPSGYVDRESAENAAKEHNEGVVRSTQSTGRIAYGFEITPEMREYLLFNSRSKFKMRDAPPVYVKPAEMEELKQYRDLIDPDAHPELIVKGKVLGINLDKVKTTEDLKRAISATSSIYEQLIDKSRRYTRSHKLTKQTAAMLGMTVDDLMARREGQAFNAEELHAAFNLTVAGARILGESAKAYNDTPSPENEARFLQALGLQRSLQEQFGGARAEAGRSLDILKVMAAGEGKYLSTVGEALSRHGNATPEVVARMITKLPSVEQMSRFVAQAERAKTADVLLEIWINSLLSGPQTHAANFIGNMMTLMNAPVERAAAGVGRAIVGGEGVQAGEAAAMLTGLFTGLREAFQITAKNLGTQLPEALAEARGAGEDLSKIDVRRQGAISGSALNVTGTAGRMLDVLGKIVRTPGGVLWASDQFFKLVNFRMEMNALAYRTATEEGLRGTERTERIRQILSGEDETSFNQLINDANSWADYQTFTNALSPGGTALLHWANANPWARMIVPFVRTPLNIFHYALDRTPLLNLAQKRMWADLKSGGARADLAVGKISSSAMLLATVAGMALSKMISGYGPSDKELRRQLMATGWQPWSVKIGNRWYAYDRLDPVGAVLGAGATFAEMWAELPEAEVESLALMGAIAFSRAMVSKTYLTGVARVVDAISDPQASAQSVFRSYVGSTVPAFLSQADRSMFDRQIRELWTYTDVLKDRVPGLSDTLPPKRDIFGHPQYYSGSLGPDYLSPIRVSEQEDYPAMQEMVKHQVRVSPPGKWIYGGKPTGVFGPTTRRERAGEGVALDPEQYDRLAQLRGGLAESLVLGAMTDPEYSRYTDGPDGGKAAILRRAFSKATEESKKQLLREYPELLGKVRERMLQRRQNRMPVDLEIVEE